jgi:hypothetical protein
MPWDMREMQVREPNQHVIRFGHGLPTREPKSEIERVAVAAQIEKRLAALLGDLAQHKRMTVGEMLEEMALHSFEKLPGGGVASPDTERTLTYIQDLKQKHGMDHDCHANYRFVEAIDRGQQRGLSGVASVEAAVGEGQPHQCADCDTRTNQNSGTGPFMTLLLLHPCRVSNIGATFTMSCSLVFIHIWMPRIYTLFHGSNRKRG